jgi:TP901 family phage tail tape measure protein
MSIRINVGATFDAKDLQRAQKELDALAKKADTLSNRMSAVGGSFQSAGKQLSAVGSTMTRRITLPIVAAGIAAVRTASDFETSFAQIEGLVGVTGDELDVLRDAAQKLGPTFGKSAGEAAEALFFITSAGLRGQDAIDVLDSSLKASASGLGDVATIADLTTSVMNAYGSDVISAASATDILTAAVREGKLQPDELAGSMGRVLPLASAMGVGFDEVGATFAALSRTGTGASEAATQLRGIMSALLKPTAGAEKALEEMGLSSEGLREQIREEGLLSVLETLTDAFGDNEQGAEDVFGNVRALSGVMDLMGANVEGTREIFKNMTDTTGILDGAFESVAGTSGFQFQQTMAEMKAVLLEVGQIIQPFAMQLVESFKGVLQTFQELSPEQQEQIVKFLAIAAAVGPLILILGKLFTAIGAIIKGVVGLGKVLMFLASPMGLIVLAIAAVIAIGWLLWKNWDAVSAKASETWNGVKEAFQTAWAGIKDTARTAGNFVIGMLNGVIGAYESAINAVSSALNRLPFVGKTLSIPNWVPLVGGNSFSIPSIPRATFPRIPMLAEGGIVRSATLAMIGEAGPEAVIPLDRMGSGMGGGDIYITVNGALDSEGVARQIERVLRDSRRRTGGVLV